MSSASQTTANAPNLYKVVSLELSDEGESSGNTRRDGYYVPEFAFDDVAVVPKVISWSYSEVTTPSIAVCTLFVAHVPGHLILFARRYRSGYEKRESVVERQGEQGAATRGRVMLD